MNRKPEHRRQLVCRAGKGEKEAGCVEASGRTAASAGVLIRRNCRNDDVDALTKSGTHTAWLPVGHVEGPKCFDPHYSVMSPVGCLV